MAERLAVHFENEASLENAITQLFPTLTDENEDDVSVLMMEKYMMYKKNYMKHLRFDPDLENLSKFSFPSHQIKVILFPAGMIEQAPLETVRIQIDTATFDQIERGLKVKGLFTQTDPISSLFTHNYQKF